MSGQFGVKGALFSVLLLLIELFLWACGSL